MFVTEVEVGSRWEYHGVTIKVLEVKYLEHGGRGPGRYVVAPPEWKIERNIRPHATDVYMEQTLLRHAMLIGDDVPASPMPVSRSERIEARAEAAAEEARAEPVRGGITPLKRAKNKVTSLRYKIKHPEKYGRTEWPKSDRTALEKELAEAEAAVESLKGT